MTQHVLEATPTPDPEAFPPLRLIVHPGTASAEDIGELLASISDLYVMYGGSGLTWTVAEPEAGI